MLAIFEIRFGGRICGGAGGRGGQTRHTKVYCMFVEFYCFNKISKLYAKAKETPAICFLKSCLADGWVAGGGAAPNAGPAVLVFLMPAGYIFTVLA